MKNKIIYVTPTSFTTCLLDEIASLDYFTRFGVELQDDEQFPSSKWIKYVHNARQAKWSDEDKENLRQSIFNKGDK